MLFQVCTDAEVLDSIATALPQIRRRACAPVNHIPIQQRQNILDCLRYGTQMGWLIDPDEQTVFVYRSKQEPEVLDEPDEIVPTPSFASELQLTVKELFSWLLE